MTGGNVVPGASTDTRLTLNSATVPHTFAPPRAEVPTVWRQTRAMRALADLLDRVGQPGLELSICEYLISVRVPDDIGGEHQRSDVVAALATALGTRSRRETGWAVSHAWLVADAELAGFPVHVFTPLGDNTGEVTR